MSHATQRISTISGSTHLDVKGDSAGSGQILIGSNASQTGAITIGHASALAPISVVSADAVSVTGSPVSIVSGGTVTATSAAGNDIALNPPDGNCVRVGVTGTHTNKIIIANPETGLRDLVLEANGGVNEIYSGFKVFRIRGSGSTQDIFLEPGRRVTLNTSAVTNTLYSDNKDMVLSTGAAQDISLIAGTDVNITATSGAVNITATSGAVTIVGTNWAQRTALFLDMVDASLNQPIYTTSGDRAYYSRQMDTIHLSSRFGWSGKGSTTAGDPVRISLPVAAANASFYASVTSAILVGAGASAGPYYIRTQYGGSAFADLLKYDPATSSSTAALWSDMPTAGTLEFSLTYFAL